ncbi:MAG: hypothetical protein K0S12_2367, partial [Bacteroidetes bacterium]|nr:hypothetical protein [Bacteroidota bacterium]
GFIFRMFWWRRQAWHYTMHHQMAYEKVRNMSEEEYSAFKNSFKNRQHYYGHCSWNDDGSCRSYSSCYDYEKRDTENKKEETEK